MLNYDSIIKINPAFKNKPTKKPKVKRVGRASEMVVNKIFDCLPLTDGVSNQWISTFTGISMKTVTAGLTELKKRNLIKRVRRNDVSYITKLGE